MTDFIFDTPGYDRYSFHPGHKIIDDAIAEVRSRCEIAYMFDLPRGWREIVAALHLDLVKIEPDYKLEQVKEKFGGLRFYVWSINDEARERINRAESLSFHVCQYTGTPGELINDHGWMRTVSPHLQRMKESR